jgi:PhoPQ-activated pathogenicity-related protein
MLGTLLAAHSATASETVVLVKSSAMIEGSIVTLGNIAQITTTLPELEAQLRDLPLTPAPSSQRTVSITINHIRDILAARGHDTSQIRITGASRSEVRRGFTPVATSSDTPAADFTQTDTLPAPIARTSAIGPMMSPPTIAPADASARALFRFSE